MYNLLIVIQAITVTCTHDHSNSSCDIINNMTFEVKNSAIYRVDKIQRLIAYKHIQRSLPPNTQSNFRKTNLSLQPESVCANTYCHYSRCMKCIAMHWSFWSIKYTLRR